MNPEIKKLWIDALRSGNYQQGRKALCQIIDGKEKYCCLGVLCEEGIKAGVDVKTSYMDFLTYSLKSYDGEIYYPPHSVITWSDLVTPNKNPMVDLSMLNDVEQGTFDQIAEWINDNL